MNELNCSITSPCNEESSTGRLCPCESDRVSVRYLRNVVLVKWNVRSILNNSDLNVVFHGRDDTLDKVICSYDNYFTKKKS
jgi:hypothetical protein